MKPRISMITLGTRQLDRAIAFYEKGLGWPRLDFDGDVAFFTLNGTWLSLYPQDLLAKEAQVAEDGHGFRGVTLSHGVTAESEVTDILTKASAAGGTIVKPAQKTDWGGFGGYFADVDGHLWDIVYNPFFWSGPKDE
jgi:catechol 2,3-dioxygenase-like lactoylglutathione lyase family enzyme